jgi:site-specific DNA-cytosine methylase
MCRSYFRQILADLSESGFDARWKVISAAEVGAPHRRDRLWIMAYPKGEGNGRESGEFCKKEDVVLHTILFATGMCRKFTPNTVLHPLPIVLDEWFPAEGRTTENVEMNNNLKKVYYARPDKQTELRQYIIWLKFVTELVQADHKIPNPRPLLNDPPALYWSVTGANSEFEGSGKYDDLGAIGANSFFSVDAAKVSQP